MVAQPCAVVYSFLNESWGQLARFPDFLLFMLLLSIFSTQDTGQASVGFRSRFHHHVAGLSQRALALAFC